MNPFNRRAGFRIAAVSVLLAGVASSLAWVVAHETAEANTVSMAVEESQRLSRQFDVTALSGPHAGERAQRAADAIVGGLFDVAEIYDRGGSKLASSMTRAGAELEKLLPTHRRPNYSVETHKDLGRTNGLWVIRVFVPLKDAEGARPDEIAGYFEGVRVVPDWQRKQVFWHGLHAALMAGLASLLCGAAIYPVVVRLAADNDRKTHEVLASNLSLMGALGQAIAKRDSDTGAHNYRVAWIAARIAERMGLQGKAMQSLIVGSFLHDIGKIGIPDAILFKPGALDDDELEIMRSHVQQGEELISGIRWLDEAHAIVSGHHEKWDGTGYPRQLAGAEIPLSARIFALADVFDALCSSRPYKGKVGFDATMEILERDSGSHFDPAVMSAFRPIARDVFDTLAQCDEVGVRRLLEVRVRLHFGI